MRNILIIILSFILIPISKVNSQVVLYRDINYGSDSWGIIATQYVSCMCTRERGSGPEHWFDCPGEGVRNDEVSSIKVAPGWGITVWWDCDFQGETRTFYQDCPDVGTHWNDQISSFKVYRTSQPSITPSQPPIAEHLGYAFLKNQSGQGLYYYYVMTANRSDVNFDFCAVRQGGGMLGDGYQLKVYVPEGKILHWYFYTSTICDRGYLKHWGTLVNYQANGSVININ